MFQIIHKKIIFAVFSPALSSTSRVSQSRSVTNFLKHISQNTILLQSEILFWHNMKIRLWKRWLPFCFFASKCSQYTKTRSCDSGASGKNEWPHHSWSGALLDYGKATSPWEHPVLQPRDKKAGDILCLLLEHKQIWTHVTKHPRNDGTAISFTSNLCLWKCYRPLTWTQKLLGPAHLVPGTTLHLLCWKAYNHFPWKDEKLCQFVCTLLQLKTIRCFQSVVLQ